MAATVNQMVRSHQTASYFVYWVRLVWKRRLFLYADRGAEISQNAVRLSTEDLAHGLRGWRRKGEQMRLSGAFPCLECHTQEDLHIDC